MTTPHARQPLAYLFLSLAALFWSGNFVLARAMHAAIPPLTLSFGRWMIALCLLTPFAIRPFLRDRHKLYQHKGRIVALGMIGVAGFNSFVYSGVQYTTATNAVLLNSFIPILTVLFGALWFQQKMSGRQALGLSISFIGVLTIVSGGEVGRLLALDLNRGDLIVFIAMVLWALYTLILRGLDPSIDRIGLLFSLVVVGCLTVLPFFLWEYHSGRQVALNQATLATFAYVGTLPSVAAYLFFNYGVAKVGPARAATFTHLMPAFGALLSTLFLNEQLHAYHALGIGGIFCCVWLSSRGR